MLRRWVTRHHMVLFDENLILGNLGNKHIENVSELMPNSDETMGNTYLPNNMFIKEKHDMHEYRGRIYTYMITLSSKITNSTNSNDDKFVESCLHLCFKVLRDDKLQPKIHRNALDFLVYLIKAKLSSKPSARKRTPLKKIIWACVATVKLISFFAFYFFCWFLLFFAFFLLFFFSFFETLNTTKITQKSVCIVLCCVCVFFLFFLK